MITLPEFKNFLAELQTLINKYSGSDPNLLTKDQRIAFAAKQTMPLYRKQFALITDYVANALDLDPGLIDQSKTRCRFARIAWARHLCMMFADELTSAPQAAIAAYYGCPSHSGVGYARRNVQAACAAYPTEAAWVERTRLELHECMDAAEIMAKAKANLAPARSGPVGPSKHKKPTSKTSPDLQSAI
jgi:hypothetical protein